VLRVKYAMDHRPTNSFSMSYASGKAIFPGAAMYEVAKLFSNVNVAFNQVSACRRCFGHVINLVVKALLWGQNADAVVQELGALDDDVDTTQRLQLWRKQGQIGCLHNICTWILSSPQWHDHFTEKAKLVVPDATAYISLIGSHTLWHGDVDGIERAIIEQAPSDEFEFAVLWEYQ